MLLGNRIPYQYFFSTGAGESDYGPAGDPFEAGSYDAALRMAGIENYNMIPYTSILPAQAVEVSKKVAMRKPLKPVFGSVMEAIFARMNGVKGQLITAALLVTRIHSPTGKYLGSFCTEYAGHGNRKQAHETLLADTREMVSRRGMGVCSKLVMNKKCKSSKKYIVHPAKFEFKSLMVKKQKGTVLAGLFFLNHTYPILKT